MDEFGTYTRGPNGEIQYIPAESSSMAINGQELYSYEQSTGVLQLAAEPGLLEKLTEQWGITEEGVNITLDTGLGQAPFVGVKKLESIGPPYFLQEPKPPEEKPEIPERATRWSRIKQYFTQES